MIPKMLVPVTPPYQPVERGTFINKIKTHPNIEWAIERNRTNYGRILGFACVSKHIVPEMSKNGRIRYKINPQS